MWHWQPLRLDQSRCLQPPPGLLALEEPLGPPRAPLVLEERVAPVAFVSPPGKRHRQSWRERE